MMTCTNHINQTIGSMNHDSPSLKRNDYRERRRSLHQQQEQQEQQQQQQQKYQYENSKRSQQHDQFSSTAEKKKKAQKRQIGEADKEDDKEQQYRTTVDSLGPYDVICGRGSLAFNNVGNRRFRVLISINIDRYNDSQGRHRKGLFIGSLVNTLQHQIGVRFFKLKDGQLIELTGRQIRQKVGHALRDVLAFQDSQYQQQQQLRKNHPHEQRKHHQNIQQQQQQQQHQQQEHKPNRNNVRSTSLTAKAEPRIIEPKTAMSPSEATLSSIRSRLNEIRAEGDEIRLQSHALPSPFPFTSAVLRTSPHTSLRQDPSQPTASRISNTLTKRSNYFPFAGNMEERGHDFEPSSALVVSSGRNAQNDTSQQNFVWNDSANTTVGSSVSKKYGSFNKKTWDHYNSNISHNSNRFDHQHRYIGESLGDIDLVPISIDDHQEPDDEAIKLLQF